MACCRISARGGAGDLKRNSRMGRGAWQQALDVALHTAHGVRPAEENPAIWRNHRHHSQVVYRAEVEAEISSTKGHRAMLQHRPLLEMAPEDASDENIVAVYSMATYRTERSPTK